MYPRISLIAIGALAAIATATPIVAEGNSSGTIDPNGEVGWSFSLERIRNKSTKTSHEIRLILMLCNSRPSKSAVVGTEIGFADLPPLQGEYQRTNIREVGLFLATPMDGHYYAALLVTEKVDGDYRIDDIVDMGTLDFYDRRYHVALDRYNRAIEMNQFDVMPPMMSPPSISAYGENLEDAPAGSYGSRPYSPSSAYPAAVHPTTSYSSGSSTSGASKQMDRDFAHDARCAEITAHHIKMDDAIDAAPNFTGDDTQQRLKKQSEQLRYEEQARREGCH